MPSKRRAQVAGLLEQGLPQAEVGRRLGLSKATVSYHARRLGIPADDRAGRRYDWDEIQRAYDSGLSVRQCAQRFGFCMDSWSSAVKRGAVRPRPRAMPIEALLVPDRHQTNRSHLKQRLLDAGLKENRCEVCGLTEWRGRPLNMSLHHINGHGKDNRLENIQFLCPNCHSQTDNWGGRGMKRNGAHAA
jgi:Bacterial regulatory proteins, luxR family/HNH endonuclease